MRAVVRRLISPHAIDELIGRDRMIDVDQQCDEHAALADMPDVEALPVQPRLDVAE